MERDVGDSTNVGDNTTNIGGAPAAIAPDPNIDGQYREFRGGLKGFFTALPQDCYKDHLGKSDGGGGENIIGIGDSVKTVTVTIYEAFQTQTAAASISFVK